MCWSFDVSLGTFLFASLCSFYLYSRNRPNDRLYALYIFVIGLMQGADALAWYSIENAIPSLNKFAAVLSRIFIALPVLVIYLYLHKSITSLVFGIMMYFVYTVYQIWNQYDSINISVKPNCKNECHLEWSWLTPNKYVPFFLYLFVYLTLLLYPLYIVKDRRTILMIAIPVLTLLYSLYRFSETNAWGSHWCSSINLWSLVAIFM